VSAEGAELFRDSNTDFKLASDDELIATVRASTSPLRVEAATVWFIYESSTGARGIGSFTLQLAGGAMDDSGSFIVGVTYADRRL